MLGVDIIPDFTNFHDLLTIRTFDFRIQGSIKIYGRFRKILRSGFWGNILVGLSDLTVSNK